jgi:hypothetical protein
MLIDKFGNEAVREAAKRLTAHKTGRKPEKDEADLSRIYFDDSELWLQGKKPTELKSNRKIAMLIAAKRPGHNRDATVRRIMRKLSNDMRHI